MWEEKYLTPHVINTHGRDQGRNTLSGIVSLFFVSLSLILDWANRHIINSIKPEKESISSNKSLRKRFGIQFWTGPIRNFLIVISTLARNPQWVLIYSVTVGFYLTGKQYYSVLSKIKN